MNHPIVNLLKQPDLDRINDIYGTKYKRVQVTTTFDKQLDYHKMTDFEYKYYKRIMETEPKGV